MTEPSPLVTDEDLNALLDGELDAGRAATLGAMVGENASVAERFQHLKADRDALRQALAPIGREAVPRRLTLAAIAARRRRRLVARSVMAMAASVILSAGVAGGYFVRGFMSSGTMQQDASARWQAVAEDAMRAHRTYSAEVRYPVEIRGDENGQLSAWITRRLGRRLPLPELGAFGFSLVGGRILPSPFGTAALVMYETTSGERISLYLKARETGETAMRTAAALGERSIYWVDDGCAYVVVGSLDRARLQAVADAVFAHFELTPNAG